MKRRRVDVVHVLARRITQGYQEYLVHAHPTWNVQALPAKKLPGSAGAALDPARVAAAFDAVWHEELGLNEAPAWRKILEPVALEMASPRTGTVTEYRIVPVVAPVDRRELKTAQARLGGSSWQRRGDLAGQGDVSPTARLALERLLALPATAEPPPRDANWTRRLLWARERDNRDHLGALLGEMSPWLLAQLRKCPETRCLFDNNADADEAVADGLLNVLLHLDDFVETASAGAWVWAITYNAAMTLLRRRGRRQTVSLYVGDEGEMRPVTADDRDLLDQIAEDERRAGQLALLGEILAQADPRHREAWEMRFNDDLQFNEIAARLGENQNTVAGWIRRLSLRMEAAARRAR